MYPECVICAPRALPVQEVFRYLGVKITEKNVASFGAKYNTARREICNCSRSEDSSLAHLHGGLSYAKRTRAIAVGRFEDNETGSLKSRDSFAHASITSCVYMETGKREEREFIVPGSRPPAT